MGYEWFNEINKVVWYFEECVQIAVGDQPQMLGVAPSAGDEARGCLRELAGRKQPLQLIEEVDGLGESEVREASLSLAQAAVAVAVERDSQHVTRQDVKAAISSGGVYPYVPRDD